MLKVELVFDLSRRPLRHWGFLRGLIGSGSLQY